MTEHVATVDELFGRDRREDRTVLVDATGREYDAHWLCTTAWKAGNFLRHSGVREDVTVGVAGTGPLTLLACFGTTLLGGTTRFDPPTDLADADDLQAIVAPVDDLESDAYDLPRGTSALGYGSEPETPGVQHFDAGLWSENPSFPPQTLDPETALLTDGDRSYAHGEVIAAADGVIDEYDLEAGTRVVVRAPLSDPRAVAAGVIAPLLADGVVVLAGSEDGAEDGAETEPAESESETGETADRGAYAVSSDPVPESHRIALDAVSL